MNPCVCGCRNSVKDFFLILVLLIVRGLAIGTERCFGRWCFGVRRCRAVSLVADARWPSAPASKGATTYRPSKAGAQLTFGRDGRPEPPLTSRRAKVRARMEMPACRSDRGARSALEEIEDYFRVACWVRAPKYDGVWEVREEVYFLRRAPRERPRIHL